MIGGNWVYHCSMCQPSVIVHTWMILKLRWVLALSSHRHMHANEQAKKNSQNGWHRTMSDYAFNLLGLLCQPLNFASSFWLCDDKKIDFFSLLLVNNFYERSANAKRFPNHTKKINCAIFFSIVFFLVRCCMCRKQIEMKNWNFRNRVKK